MQSVNPFLRAFFRSTLPSQCHPIQHHVLLVPTTDVLVHSKDRETDALLAELVNNEEFLASHILHIPGGVSASGAGKDGNNINAREAKLKAKQYTTVNSRTVVIKESFVYSNKGFKSLVQAQLLSDAVFYPDVVDNQQWLIYYISKPLVGTVEPLKVEPAILTTKAERELTGATQEGSISPRPSSATPTRNPHKRDVKTFSELLNEFPVIARSMLSGLDGIFKEFSEQFSRPVVKQTSRPPSVRSQSSTASLHDSLATLRSNVSSEGTTLRHDSFGLDEEEQALRQALEAAVMAAIDLFQAVDKQQLSMVGATTSLSGPAVEQLIERYVAEQLFERALFPRLCQIKREEDVELESRIRRMQDVDIAQVGIPIEGGREGKRKLALRLDEATAMFKKQGVASGPQEMIETLLATEKIIATGSAAQAKSDNETEKQALAMTMNADTLVSMLLIVVIRSGVRHLYARLTCMRHFVFLDEVETGEIGYALSTLEAVLAYLSRDSDPLRRASKQNRQLWQSAKEGNLARLQSLLEPFGTSAERSPVHADSTAQHSADDDDKLVGRTRSPSLTRTSGLPSGPSQSTSHVQDFAAVGGSLEHVFPFQRPPTPPPEVEKPRKKRVSLATARSHSTSSVWSSAGHSRRASSNSVASGASGSVSADTSLETLAQTQNGQGDSLLMMAVDAGHEDILAYLLTLEEHYTLDFLLDDCNTEGTTLFSAAVQGEKKDLTNLLLDHILRLIKSRHRLEQYLGRQDSKGRCAAHYAFNQPELLQRLGYVLPWRLKDRNGQTPLFALCRSYDHPDYHAMVNLAISLATTCQPRKGKLELDDHVDHKGNTLLHIINDATIATRILRTASVDVNAVNDKKFTPFMLASKYGKMDLVRTLFHDPRVELRSRDYRGLSAIELAKDDEIRNKIDDMSLLSTRPDSTGRFTSVVRSYFVEDSTVKVILKSALSNGNGSMTITTCRRSLADFENLAKWLNTEHPASWLPLHFNMTSPFLISSKPSRAVLRDIELRLDNFLQNLLTHGTFAHHEMVWEFFLVPDIDPAMLTERSKHKAEIRAENVRDDYEPVTDTSEIELFVSHAYDQVRKVSTSTRNLIRRLNRQRQRMSDIVDISRFASTALDGIAFLPARHKTAFDRLFLAQQHYSPDSSPLTSFYYALHGTHSASTALLVALQRPKNLVGTMESSRAELDRGLASLARQSRWTPKIGFFDETRKGLADEAHQRVEKTRRELESLGSELRYTQQTVAAELAAWQEEHVRTGRRALRDLARAMIVKERDRLEAMRRACREIDQP